MPDKLVEALRLRNEERKTYQEIGIALDVSTTAAWKMINNEKRRIAVELEEERTAKAKESEDRFDVIKTTEELVTENVRAAKENPTDPRIVGAAYTGLKLLAQLRGEFVEKRENKNENHEFGDIDGDYFEKLLERFCEMADSDNGGGNNG